jgi:hypothetical protein
MVLADVGLGQLIWTTLFIFMLVMFLWVFILAVGDLFRDRELSGWAKAGWLVALIFSRCSDRSCISSRGAGG